MEEDNLFIPLLDLSDTSIDNNEITFNPFLYPKSKKNRAKNKKYDSPDLQVTIAALRAFTFDMELIQSMDEDQHGNVHPKIVSLLKKIFQEQEEIPKIENFYTATLVKAVDESDTIMPRMNTVLFCCNEQYILEYHTNAHNSDDERSYNDSIETAQLKELAQKAAKEYLNTIIKHTSPKERRKIAIQKIESCIKEYDALKNKPYFSFTEIS